VLDRLVELLGSRTPEVLRELAFGVLRTDIDPESRAVPGLYQYDATGSAEALDAGRQAWKRRVEELKRRTGEPKQE
jgi:hypothetical protein